MSYLDSIIAAESGGNPTARNPRSSAYGAGQFIERTWLDMLAKHRPDLIAGKSRAEILEMRADPRLSREMTAAYASDNTGLLRSHGLPVTAGTTYLAHFAGPQGAVNVLKADPSAPVGSVLGENAVAANPHLRGMTIADLTAWANRKMGGASPAPQGGPQGAPQTAAPATAPQAPMALSGAPASTRDPRMQALANLGQMFGSMSPQQAPTPPPPLPQILPDPPAPDLRPLLAYLASAQSGALL